MSMFILPGDLAPFATIDPAKAEAMIEDAEAMAILTAPCLPDLATAPDGETPEELAARLAKLAAVKSILRAAILRWDEAGSGTVQSQTAGPFTQMFQQQARKSLFWPSELEQLQGICSGGQEGDAFTLDTAPSVLSSGPLWWGYEVGNWSGPDISGS